MSNTKPATVSHAAPDVMRLAEMAESMSGVGHWRFDAISQHLHWSAQVFRIHGLDPADGQPELARAIEVFHPDDRALVSAHVETTLNDGTPYAFELRIVPPNGEVRYVSARGAAERDPFGRIVAVFGTVMDVTEARRADRELADSEARYRHLAENSTDIIAVYDLVGRLDYLSPSVRFVLGYEPAELIGRRSVEIMHPEDAGRIGAAFQAAMAHEGPQGAPPIEYRAIAKDGRVVWLEAHPKALHDPMTGAVIAYQDAIRDITRRKDVELKLAEMEARYALLAEHSHDLLMVSDLDGRLTYISPSLRATTGADPEPLLGRRYVELVHRDDVARLETLRARTLGAGHRGPAERVEYRARHIDGHWMWFETTPLPMIDATGRATGILDVARDVTERKMLGEQLERKCEEAEAAAVAKTEFLANMSHEIRTPLTGVIGFSDLLSDLDDLPPTAKLYADRISTAGRSLLTVVNDILDFSKLEAGQLVLDPHGFTPMDFVAETLDLVAGQVEAKGLSLTVRQDGVVPGHVEADSARLRQVLLNLLTNAVKFTAEGGVDVTVAYDEAGGGRLRIAVTDTGAGVPEALKDRLFQRFSQVDGSISRQHGGTGLGLAICKSLIGLMGGEIGVESAVGQGSTFWFTLAAPQTEAVPAESGGAHVAEGLELSAARILVVDDVMANRELVRAILSPFGHIIVEAENGSDAVSQAIQSRFDVILMDLQMPGMDGLAATRAIRATAEQNRATPIIALSANVLPEQIGECLAAGMDDHVAKPIKVADLLQKVFQWAAGEALDEAAA